MGRHINHGIRLLKSLSYLAWNRLGGKKRNLFSEESLIFQSCFQLLWFSTFFICWFVFYFWETYLKFHEPKGLLHLLGNNILVLSPLKSPINLYGFELRYFLGFCLTLPDVFIPMGGRQKAYSLFSMTFSPQGLTLWFSKHLIWKIEGFWSLPPD